MQRKLVEFFCCLTELVVSGTQWYIAAWQLARIAHMMSSCFVINPEHKLEHGMSPWWIAEGPGYMPYYCKGPFTHNVCVSFNSNVYHRSWTLCQWYTEPFSPLTQCSSTLTQMYMWTRLLQTSNECYRWLYPVHRIYLNFAKVIVNVIQPRLYYSKKLTLPKKVCMVCATVIIFARQYLLMAFIYFALTISSVFNYK